MSSSSHTDAIRDAAQSYLKRGWSVVPLVPGGKRPLVRWTEYQTRLPSVQELEAWLKKWPDANIAIVTGSRSGLVVMDVDPRNGGAESLRSLEEVHGALPPTIEAITGGRGRHIYFRHPGGTVHNRVAMKPGIDLRADGGMVAAPPSLHPSGRHYGWRVSFDPDEVSLAPLPSWLLDLVEPHGGRPGHSADHWRCLVREGVAEGERNNTIASLSGHLLQKGVDGGVVADLMLCWNALRCRPPLSDDEVARTVKSVARLHVRAVDADQRR